MNLIEGIQSECNRVREIITEYESLPNNAGAFASMMMKGDIKRAENIIATGDVIQMLQIYKALKSYEL
jgi:hypothetical protein